MISVALNFLFALDLLIVYFTSMLLSPRRYPTY